MSVFLYKAFERGFLVPQIFSLQILSLRGMQGNGSYYIVVEVAHFNYFLHDWRS